MHGQHTGIPGKADGETDISANQDPCVDLELVVPSNQGMSPPTPPKTEPFLASWDINGCLGHGSMSLIFWS